MKVAKGETELRFEVPEPYGDGAVILYKRCPRPMFESLRKAHIIDERLFLSDIFEVAKAVAQKCTTGWENVTDMDTGEPLEFTEENFALLDENLRVHLGYMYAEHILKQSWDEVEKMLKSIKAVGIRLLKHQYGIKDEQTEKGKPEGEAPAIPLPDSSPSPTT